MLLTYRGVALLWLARLAREQDHLGLVQLESLRVQLEGLGRLVAAPVVNGNANGAGESLEDAGRLQLVVREASSGAHLGVVAPGRAVDDWSQWSGRGSWRHLGRLCQASVASALVSGWLVVPCAHESNKKWACSSVKFSFYRLGKNNPSK